MRHNSSFHRVFRTLFWSLFCLANEVRVLTKQIPESSLYFVSFPKAQTLGIKWEVNSTPALAFYLPLRGRFRITRSLNYFSLFVYFESLYSQYDSHKIKISKQEQKMKSHMQKGHWGKQLWPACTEPNWANQEVHNLYSVPLYQAPVRPLLLLLLINYGLDYLIPFSDHKQW